MLLGVLTDNISKTIIIISQFGVVGKQCVKKTKVEPYCVVSTLLME